MESTNRISTPGGTWTVDRNGYVAVGAVGNSSGNYRNLVYINGKAVAGKSSTNGSANEGNLDVLQVSVGDTITFYAGTSAHQCYFIPQKIPLELHRLLST